MNDRKWKNENFASLVTEIRLNCYSNHLYYIHLFSTHKLEISLSTYKGIKIILVANLLASVGRSNLPCFKGNGLHRFQCVDK